MNKQYKSPLSTRDPDVATPFMGSIVNVPLYPFGVVLASVYNNGFMTSAGFKTWIELPAEPIPIEKYDGIIIFNDPLLLPMDYKGWQCLFAPVEELLIEANDPLFDAMLNNEDIPLNKLIGVDFDTMQFKSDDGNSYPWLLKIF